MIFLICLMSRHVSRFNRVNQLFKSLSIVGFIINDKQIIKLNCW